MTLVIDTGEQAPRTALSHVPSWFMDFYPDGTPDEKIVQAYAYHLIGALHAPKKIDTVRKHTLAQWGFLAFLAESDPSVFDEFICTYAERVLGS